MKEKQEQKELEIFKTAFPESFIPIGALLIIDAIPVEKVTKSGIIIEQSEESMEAHDFQREGVVVALGTGVMLPSGTRTQFSVEVGAKVVFKNYSGRTIKFDDKEYLTMLESDLLVCTGCVEVEFSK